MVRIDEPDKIVLSAMLSETSSVVAFSSGRFVILDDSRGIDIRHEAPDPTGSARFRASKGILSGALFAAQKRFPMCATSFHSSIEHYVQALVSNFHVTKATPECFSIARSRFERLDRSDLADLAAEKVTDESGHHLLAARDLNDLGYKWEELTASYCPSRAGALVSFLKALVAGPEPIGCFGYAYTLEWLALFVDEGTVSNIERLLPDATHATRCMKVHSAEGADGRHVEELSRAISSLSSEEIAEIARAAYKTMCIVADTYNDDKASVEELRVRFSRFRVS